MAINYTETKLFCVSKWQHWYYLFSETGFVSIGKMQGINGILFISILNGLCTYATFAYSEIPHRLTKRIWKRKQTNIPKSQTIPEQTTPNLFWRVKIFKMCKQPIKKHYNKPIHSTSQLHHYKTSHQLGERAFKNKLRFTSLQNTHKITKICSWVPFLHSFTEEYEFPGLPSYRQIISCSPKEHH